MNKSVQNPPREKEMLDGSQLLSKYRIHEHIHWNDQSQVFKIKPRDSHGPSLILKIVFLFYKHVQQDYNETFKNEVKVLQDIQKNKIKGTIQDL